MTSPDTPRPRDDSRSPRPAASESQTAPLDNGTESPVSRRAFLGQAGKLAAGTAGLSLTPALLAACGSTSTHVDSSTTATGQEGDWTVDGARTLPEVIVTAPSSDRGTVSVYDTEFSLLRQGRMRGEATLVGQGELRAPTLAFPYIVWEGADTAAREVLRRVDLESGTDEVVFEGAFGRRIQDDLVIDPVTGEYFFAYNTAREALAPREIWRAVPGDARRVLFEESFREAMREDEELPVAPSPLTATVRPLALAPDTGRLFFMRYRLYALDLTSGEVHQLHDHFTLDAAVAPDGSRLAVSFQDLNDASDRAGRQRLVVLDLHDGPEVEILLPEPYEPRRPIWHPSGELLACEGATDVDLLGDDEMTRVLSTVFVVDTATREARQMPENRGVPATPTLIPADALEHSSEFKDEYLDNTWSHEPIGFSADGRILYVGEARMHINPSLPASTTTSTPEDESGSPPPVTPLVVTRGGVVAIDTETAQRGALLPDHTGPTLVLRR
ncbi:MAG: hypothetical protein M5T61_14335 [Acidimicrobiia bacterium]|nr:hypothetical protein [Acidimicrobiia bacterium]